MKNIKLILLTTLLGSLLLSCHTQKELSPANGWYYDNSNSGGFQKLGESRMVVSNEVADQSTGVGRKVLHSASLWLTVSAPDTANGDIEKITKKIWRICQSIGDK